MRAGRGASQSGAHGRPPVAPPGAAVDLWVADGAWRAPTGALPPSEQAVAAGMRSSDARRRHVRARTLLRLVLGHRLGLAAPAVPLSPTGRPVVDLPDAPWVGVAHAGDVVLVGVRDDGPVGVDVEVLGRRRPVPAVATDRGRARVVARLSAGGDDPALLAWVLQEAALKALGIGLAVPLGDVRLEESDVGVLVDVPGHPVCRAVACRRGDALVAVAVPGPDPPAPAWHAAPEGG